MLSTRCENGHRLTAPDRYAGRTSRCPNCGSTVTFPMADDTSLEELGSEELDDTLAELEELQRKEQAEKAERRRPRQEEAANKAIEKEKSEQKAKDERLRQRLVSMVPPVNCKLILGGSIAAGFLLVAFVFAGFWGVAKPPKSVANPEPAVAVPESAVQESPPTTTTPAAAPPANQNKTADQTKKAAAKPASMELDGKWTELKLPLKATPHAFDPIAGRLIIRTPNGPSQDWHVYQPEFFDGNKTDGQKIELPEAIATVGFKTWKDRHFVVACTEPKTSNTDQAGTPARMMLLDAVTLLPIQEEHGLRTSIALDLNQPKFVFDSPPADPEVLVSTESYSVFVDLRDGHQSRFPIGSALIANDMRDIVGLSQSARYVHLTYGRVLRTNRNLSTDSSVEYLTPGTAEMEPAIDPFDQLGITKAPIMPPGIRQLTSTSADVTPFQNDVIFRCFMRKLPWLVATDKKQLHWLSRETGQIVASIPLPDGKINAIFDDAEHQRLIVITAESAMVFPYDATIFPPNDAIVATLDLPERVAPGQTVSVPFVSPTQQLKISLLEGPASAKILKDRLEWTPQDSEIGPVRFKIRYEQGIDIKDDMIESVVSRTPVPLPFEPRKFEVSTGERYVVAWNIHPSVYGQPLDRPRVAVYDMETKQITGQAIWEHNITDLAVSSEYVAVLSKGHWSEHDFLQQRQSGGDLHLYRLPDLTPVRTEKVEPPAMLVKAIGSKTILLCRETTKGMVAKNWPFMTSTYQALKLPELTLETWDRYLSAIGSPGFPYSLLQAPDGRWVIGDVGLDSDAERVVNFFNSGRWQVPYANSQITQSGFGFATQQDSRSPLLVGKPSIAAPIKSASTRWSTNHPDRGTGTISLMSIFDYLNPEPKVTKVAWSTHSKWDDYNSAPIVLTKYGAVCVAEGLHVLPLETVLPKVTQDEPKSARILPLKVRAVDGQFSLKSGGTLKFEATGGTAPYKFEYLKDNSDPDPLVELSPVGHGEQVALKYAKTQDRLVSNFCSRLVKENTKTAAKEIVDSYSAQIDEAFDGLITRSPNEVPVLFHLSVKVTDANGQSVVLSHHLFLQVPTSVVLKQIQNRLKK